VPLREQVGSKKLADLSISWRLADVPL